jgi:hypothetical protein
MQNIKDFLSYDQETGIFTWVKKPNPNIKVGSIAGTPNKFGYIQIGYNYKHYRAHRLAWFFTYGEMPKFNIDHKNEIKSDNRICNLRLDTNKENEHNISALKINNTSGYRGVHWTIKGKKWIASIKVKGKPIYLGSYDKPEEAHAAYLCAKRELHPYWIEKTGESPSP